MNTDEIKKSTQRLNLNEKEKADIDYALNMLDKVTQTDLLFIDQVLTELRAKIFQEKTGNKYEMQNWSIEQCEEYLKFKGENLCWKQ